MATAKEKIKYVGSPIERVEDNILLQGKAQYSDHLPTRAGTAHAAILRSTHAHAEINSININKAKAYPGVLDVLTGDDIKEMSEAFLIVLRAPINQWALAVGRVRYVGEPVAIVIARDRYIAEDAVGLIEVDYTPLARDRSRGSDERRRSSSARGCGKQRCFNP